MIGQAPRAPRIWWLRPWAIGVWVLPILPLIGLIGAAVAGKWRPFYAPSEAMSPTLMKGDRFFAAMKGAKDLKRGDVIVFDMPTGHYIKRVAALPGDRIEVVNGLVYLNGDAVTQSQLGVDTIEPVMGANKARRLAERFPGEARPHLIWDIAYTAEVDDFPETIVRPGHVFVLGDNRDQSADSRVPVEQMGVDQVPIASIRGKALFYGFFSSRRIGKPI
jgi:signal peptidase I